MKISELWLREWVNPPMTTAELVRKLTMAGLEVDATEPAAADFSGVVVAEVQKVEPHPDAGKLQVCTVFDGEMSKQVVCGASNVRTGLKVPFARIGAKLGPDFTIKQAKLRGIESNGMLCSAEELGMAESAEGLLELPSDATVGMNIREYLSLDDTLIEVDLTPNRGDCLGIAGLARELGALAACKVFPPRIDPVVPVNSEVLPVELQANDACPRYLGRVIRNINQQIDTPLWMQEKLRRCGLRSIDPVVDVTNYVLLEMGQPMHAFDLDKLKGGIRVRMATAGETLHLLDGKEIKLESDTLVIADHHQALAMAGIMGGKNSAVSSRTTDIFLECAYFNPLAIAGRARKYGLHTDSSHRYERGVDPELQGKAMERATALLLEIVGGEAGPVTEAVGTLPPPRKVGLRKARLESLLGLSLEESVVLGILQGLGLEILEKDARGWLFAVPSWRFDINIEEDLIEEVARVHGYDRLPVSVPQMHMRLSPTPESRLGLRALRHRLAALGFQEVVTYSFVDAELDAVLSGLDGQAGREPLKLANPISQDMAVMRSNLWPGLIKTLKHNQNRQQQRAKLFETGLVFNIINNKLEQELKVGCLLWGSACEEQWGHASRPADFYDLKGDLESMLGLTLALDQFSFIAAVHPALQPGLCASIQRAGKVLGWIGALHPAIAQAIDLNGKVFLAELDYKAVSAARVTTVTPISRFPAVRRDLALVLPENIESISVLECLQECCGENLLDIGIFDLYQGQNIENGKKSLALDLTFQHPSRTLVDTDINPIIDNCIKVLQAKFKAELR